MHSLSLAAFLFHLLSPPYVCALNDYHPSSLHMCFSITTTISFHKSPIFDEIGQNKVSQPFNAYVETVSYIIFGLMLGTASSHKGWTSLELSGRDVFWRLWS